MMMKPAIVVTKAEFIPAIHFNLAQPDQQVIVVSDEDGQMICTLGGQLLDVERRKERTYERSYAKALMAAIKGEALCEGCGNPATCVGEYETCNEEVAFACDHCCGHGNEDGWCKPLEDFVGVDLSRVKRDQLRTALANIGFDITCGACAQFFYTGAPRQSHDESCQTRYVHDPDCNINDPMIKTKPCNCYLSKR